MEIENMTKKDILKSLTRTSKAAKKSKSRFTRVINMKYPNETKDGLKRCGNCGEFKQMSEFKKKGSLMPDWKCKDCSKFLGEYK
ncbi:MAG: hypothetical protein ACTSQA_00080 [Candidatus Heimdallarchaeaceae archaeon]